MICGIVALTEVFTNLFILCEKEICFKLILSLNSLLASGDLSSADNFCKQFGPRSGPT